MFLKTKTIKTKRAGTCNARACSHDSKAIPKGKTAVWTVHLYRGRTISAVWHTDCHRQAMQFRPYWDKLMAIREGKEVLAMPLADYCPKTGRPIKKW